MMERQLGKVPLQRIIHFGPEIENCEPDFIGLYAGQSAINNLSRGQHSLINHNIIHLESAPILIHCHSDFLGSARVHWYSTTDCGTFPPKDLFQSRRIVYDLLFCDLSRPSLPPEGDPSPGSAQTLSPCRNIKSSVHFWVKYPTGTPPITLHHSPCPSDKRCQPYMTLPSAINNLSRANPPISSVS